MFGASFGVVSQALEIYRKAFDIRNRNVLNANNPDYVEENPVIDSYSPAGIIISDVRRDQSIYYLNLRNQKLSTVSYLQNRSDVLANVEGVFQELLEGLGISDYVNRFFEAYQDLMKNPTNDGAKAELFNSAKAVADFLKNRGRDLDRLDYSVDYNLNNVVRKINELTRKLYVINKDITISYAQTYARGKDYKNLLDTRDKYLRELSELINISVQEDEIGRVKVITSKGFALVDFQDNYWTLDYKKGVLYWNSKDGNKVDITDVIEAGKVKGLLDAREDIQNLKSRLNDVANYLISSVYVPRANSGTWFLLKNQQDTTSFIGVSGTLELYDSAGTYLGKIVYASGSLEVYDSTDTLVATYSEANLTNFQDAINTHFGASFSASIVNNPDGTYTLQITESSAGSKITDSGGIFFESSRVFKGLNGLSDIAPADSLRSDLDDLNYETADTFSGFATTWWEDSKGLVQTFINDLSTVQSDTKDKLRIEEALLESFERKLQEMQGVSIDNEFMEIMKIRRGYEAVARIVSTIDELIRTTLNMA